MGFLSRLFGQAPSAPASRPQSVLASGMNSVQGPNLSRNSTRRELLRVVLRDTLNRHGVPVAWIGAEVLASTSRNGEQGMHWRLLIKHWDPRLLECGPAIQQNLIKRLTSFDPMASNWLSGISWQFAMPDESACPPMPHPGVWTQPAPAAPVTPVRPRAATRAAAPEAPSGDVIAGPVRIGDPKEESARADLERLLAVRDADFRAHAADGTPPVYAATQPAQL